MEMFNLQLSDLVSNEKRRVMIQFEVNDMTCGHCVGAVTAAVKKVAPDAVVLLLTCPSMSYAWKASATQGR